MTIKEDKVNELFDDRALKLEGNNAVLSSDSEQKTQHQNIYRDFVTKQSILKFAKFNSLDIVLDYGCGIGRIANLVAEKTKHVYGVDVSVKMITRAKENNNFNNVSYYSHRDTGLIQDSFSKVYTCWVLQHMSDEQVLQFLESIKNKLTTNATLIFLEQTSKDNIIVEGVLMQRTKEHYHELFASAGYNILKTKNVFRMPSYGMDFWNRYGFSQKILFLCRWIELLLIKYKSTKATYFSTIFILNQNS